MGKEVVLSGWVNSRRDHGGVIFIDLRDHTGLVQLAIHPDDKDAFAVADKVRDEFVVEATGEVIKRTGETINPNLETGTVEILASEFSILTLPVPSAVTYFLESSNKLNLVSTTFSSAVAIKLPMNLAFDDLNPEPLSAVFGLRSSNAKFIGNFMILIQNHYLLFLVEFVH